MRILLACALIFSAGFAAYGKAPLFWLAASSATLFMGLAIFKFLSKGQQAIDEKLNARETSAEKILANGLSVDKGTGLAETAFPKSSLLLFSVGLVFFVFAFFSFLGLLLSLLPSRSLP